MFNCLLNTSFFILRTKKIVDVKSYYELINKAELAIVDSQYHQAAQFYEKAFLLKFPNDKDLRNAFLVAYAQRNAGLAKQYLNDLSYTGMPLSLVESMDLPDKGFFFDISKQCDSFYEAGKSKRNPALVSVLDSVYRQDKTARDMEIIDPSASDSVIYMDLKNVKKSDKSRLLQADSLDDGNMERLRQYIAAHGFPSFEQKGWWSKPGSTDYDACDQVFLVLWNQMGMESTPVDSVIQDAVLKGDFRPDYWEAAQIQRTSANKKFHIILSKSDSNLTAEELNEINRKRASLYLESLADYRKKYEAQNRWNEHKPQYPFSVLNPYLVDYNILSKPGIAIRGPKASRS